MWFFIGFLFLLKSCQEYIDNQNKISLFSKTKPKRLVNKLVYVYIYIYIYIYYTVTGF